MVLSIFVAKGSQDFMLWTYLLLVAGAIRLGEDGRNVSEGVDYESLHGVGGAKVD